MQLTTDQERAVHSLQQGDVCVIAGPGSGKTLVLIERLRWLILEKEIAPERILAITFTESAAQEMRSRAARDLPEDKRQKIHEAQISTIDAFCNRLVREHAIEADVDPEFEILDELEGRNLLHKAIEKVLSECYAEQNEELRQFIESLGKGARETESGESYNLLDSFASLIYIIQGYGCEPFLSGTPGESFILLRSALRDCGDSYQGVVQEELKILIAEMTEMDKADHSLVNERMEFLDRIDMVLKKNSRKKQKYDSPFTINKIRGELIPEYRSCIVSDFNFVSRQYLLDITRRMLAAYQESKSSTARMDFNDVTGKATELLSTGSLPTLNYEHIMIDEFQDTNPVQNRLFERLVDAHSTQRPECFIVGDLNQSIYGFRHAAMKVFSSFREKVERSGGQVVYLRDNFRSRNEVLDSVHQVLCNSALEGIESHRLESSQWFSKKKIPSVEFSLVSNSKECNHEPLALEALWIADRLHELKHSLQVTDHQNESLATRDLEWRDIYILLLTNSKTIQFANLLGAEGIPCITDNNKDFFQDPVVQELASFVRILRNPRDEISLATVLKSPFCGINDDDLLLIKNQQPYSCLANLLNEKKSLDYVHDPRTIEKITRFRELFQDCRADCETVPVAIVLARAIASCGYRTYLSKQPSSVKSHANTEALLHWINQNENPESASLNNVSVALDLALNTNASQKSPPDQTASVNAVRVITMHAAKGLEAPLIVLPSLNSPSGRKYPDLLFSEEYGIGACWLNPYDGENYQGNNLPQAPKSMQGSPEPYIKKHSSDWAHYKTKKALRNREKEEANRVLYVAMTRAEEHLIMGCSYSGTPSKTGWSGLLFSRLGINTKGSDLNSGLRKKTTGDVQFRYQGTTALPSRCNTDDLNRSACERMQVLQPLQPCAQAEYAAAVTSITQFAKCPRQYYLSRYLGLDSEGSENSFQVKQEGDVMVEPDKPSGPKFGRDVHLYLAGDLEEKAITPEILELAEKFKSHELGRRLDNAKSVEYEKGFVFVVNDSLLRGQIDLLFEESDERILVDYKTDELSREELPEAALRYAPQLQLYAAGLAKSGQSLDKATLFFLRHSQAVDVDISEEALDRSRMLVNEFFEAQKKLDFPLMTGKHCYHCPHFKGNCPAVYP